MRTFSAAAVALLFACSGGNKRNQADCDRLANDILRAAMQDPMVTKSVDPATGKLVPTPGVCVQSNPSVQQRYAKACSDLDRCNAEVDD